MINLKLYLPAPVKNLILEVTATVALHFNTNNAKSNLYTQEDVFTLRPQLMFTLEL